MKEWLWRSRNTLHHPINSQGGYKSVDVLYVKLACRTNSIFSDLILIETDLFITETNWLLIQLQIAYWQDPQGLEERVEVFLEQFEKDLQKMTDEDFKVLCLFFDLSLL